MRLKAVEELRTTEETYVRDLEFLKKVQKHFPSAQPSITEPFY